MCDKTKKFALFMLEYGDTVKSPKVRCTELQVVLDNTAYIGSFCAKFWYVYFFYCTKKMKFSIKDFLIKCDQIHRKLRIWSHLLKKPLIENFIFCAVFMADKQSAHLTNTIAYNDSCCYMTISA